MFKPNLIFAAVMFAASWMISRRFRELGIVALGAVIAITFAFVLSSLVFLSATCWIEWFAAVRAMPASIISTQMGNYALERILFDLTGVHLSLWLMLLCLGAPLLCLLTGMRRRELTTEEGPDCDFLRDELMVAAGCLVYLLSAPLAWIHYFLLTLPMIVISFRPLGAQVPQAGILVRRGLGAVALLGLSVHPIATLFGASDPHFFALTFSGSTLILFGLALWEMWLIAPSVQPSMRSQSQPLG